MIHKISFYNHAFKSPFYTRSTITLHNILKLVTFPKNECCAHTRRMFSKFRFMARATCIMYRQISMYHADGNCGRSLVRCENFFSSNAVQISLVLLNVESSEPHQTPKSQIHDTHTKFSLHLRQRKRHETIDTKMGNVNTNPWTHELKLFYNQTYNITFNLDSIECTSVFSDVCGWCARNTKWEMREDICGTIFTVTNIWKREKFN